MSRFALTFTGLLLASVCYGDVRYITFASCNVANLTSGDCSETRVANTLQSGLMVLGSSNGMRVFDAERRILHSLPVSLIRSVRSLIEVAPGNIVISSYYDQRLEQCTWAPEKNTFTCSSVPGTLAADIHAAAHVRDTAAGSEGIFALLINNRLVYVDLSNPTSPSEFRFSDNRDDVPDNPSLSRVNGFAVASFEKYAFFGGNNGVLIRAHFEDNVIKAKGQFAACCEHMGYLVDEGARLLYVLTDVGVLFGLDVDTLVISTSVFVGEDVEAMAKDPDFPVIYVTTDSPIRLYRVDLPTMKVVSVSDAVPTGDANNAMSVAVSGLYASVFTTSGNKIAVFQTHDCGIFTSCSSCFGDLYCTWCGASGECVPRGSLVSSCAAAPLSESQCPIVASASPSSLSVEGGELVTVQLAAPLATPSGSLGCSFAGGASQPATVASDGMSVTCTSGDMPTGVSSVEEMIMVVTLNDNPLSENVTVDVYNCSVLMRCDDCVVYPACRWCFNGPPDARCAVAGSCAVPEVAVSECPVIEAVSPYRIGIIDTEQTMTLQGSFFYSDMSNPAIEKFECQFETVENGTIVVPATATSSSVLQCVLPPVKSFQAVLISVLFDGEEYTGRKLPTEFGFSAEYFDLAGSDFVGAPFATRIDSTINFGFDANPPTPGRTTYFGARWTTYFYISEASEYTFCFDIDDGGRLYLDGVLIIDAWYIQATTRHCSAPILLDSNQRSPLLVFEYYEGGGNHAAILYVQSSTSPLEVLSSQASLRPVEAQQRVEIFDCAAASGGVECTQNVIGCAYCYDTDGNETGVCSVATSPAPCVDPAGTFTTTSVITSVSPTSLQIGKTAMLTLTGSQFVDGVECLFDIGPAGTHASAATYSSSSRLTCATPEPSAFEYLVCAQRARASFLGREASSFHSAPLAPAYGILDGDTAWCSSGNSPGEWYQLDLGAEKTVEGVETQGRANTNQWVTSFRVRVSTNGVDFTTVSPTSFTGNTDRNTKVRNLFDDPVTARYVRLEPLTYSGYTCVRMDAIICDVERYTGDVAVSLSYHGQPFASPKPLLLFDCGTLEDTCGACLLANAPECGWCPGLRSCQPRIHCSSQDPAGILSVCPASLEVRPSSGSIEGGTTLSITSTVLPSNNVDGMFACVIGGVRVPATAVSSLVLQCVSVPRSVAGTTTLAVEYNNKQWDAVPRPLPVTFYDCAEAESASCQDCLADTASYSECTWCAAENRCGAAGGCSVAVDETCPAIASSSSPTTLSVTGGDVAVPVAGLVTTAGVAAGDYECSFDGSLVTATAFGEDMESIVCPAPARSPGFGNVTVVFKGVPFVDNSLPLTYVCPAESEDVGGTCACSIGFEGDGIACTACGEEAYKDTVGAGPCVACPGNAEAVDTRDACTCKAGFFVDTTSDTLVCLSPEEREQQNVLEADASATSTNDTGLIAGLSVMGVLLVCMCIAAVVGIILLKNSSKKEDQTPKPPVLTPKLLEDIAFGGLAAGAVPKDEAERLGHIAEFLRKDAEGMCGHDPYAFINGLCDFATSSDIEPLSRNLVVFFEANGGADELIKSRVTHEMMLCKSINTAFRTNSIATKMFSAYAKMKGVRYLNENLGMVINQVLREGAVEVDESKIGAGDDLALNRFTLMISTQRVASAIFNSTDSVPLEFRRIFNHVETQFAKKFTAQGGGFDTERMMEESVNAHIRAALSSELFDDLKVAEKDGPERISALRSFFDTYDEVHARLEELKVLSRDLEAVADPNSKAAAEVAKRQKRSNNAIAVGGFFFLRLVVPAITFPEIYALVTEPPDQAGRRHLTLVAKVLQNLSNNKYFTNKELYMAKMNGWIDENLEQVHVFFEKLTSNIPYGDPPPVTVPPNYLMNSTAKIYEVMVNTKGPMVDYLKAAGDVKFRASTIPALRRGEDVLARWDTALSQAEPPRIGMAPSALNLDDDSHLDDAAKAERDDLQRQVDDVLEQMGDIDTTTKEGQEQFKQLRKKKIALQNELIAVKKGLKRDPDGTFGGAGRQKRRSKRPSQKPRPPPEPPTVAALAEMPEDNDEGEEEGEYEDDDDDDDDDVANAEEGNCEFCEATPAVLSCDECAMVYCQKCSMRRHKKGATATHTLVEITPMLAPSVPVPAQSAATCEFCEEEVATLNCADCETLYCESCSTQRHKKGSKKSHIIIAL